MLLPTAAFSMTVLAAVECVGLFQMGEMDICEYWSLIGELTEHPECIDTIEETTSKPTTKPLLLSTCSSSAELVQCTHDSVTCPRSGQACLQTNGKKCCQAVTRGVPASDINAKAGSCPTPPGISVPKDTAVGCWLDSGCPGVQKCCVEPNPTTNSAARICRDPVGVSSTSICILPLVVGSCNAPSTRFYYDSASGKCNTFQYSGCGGNSNNFQSLTSCQATCEASGVIGTPACPAKANAGLNCFFEHKDACRTDSDCLGRESNVQPSCCRTTCGHRICYLY